MATAASCSICLEVYNLEERKPLLLLCSHTFCRSCLQQMQSKNNKLCPVCRTSWEGLSVDNLPFTRQQAEVSEKQKNEMKSDHQNICAVHNADQILWCKDCKVSICNRCLIEDHKSCNFMTIEAKVTELVSNLHESVTSTRKKLIDNFDHVTTENNSQLTDIQENIKKLQRAEKIAHSFRKQIPTRLENAMNMLEKYEKINSSSSVNELTMAISKTISLLDDSIVVPILPKIVVPDCVEPADVDTDSEVELAGDVAAHSNTNTSSSSPKARSCMHDVSVTIYLYRPC